MTDYEIGVFIGIAVGEGHFGGDKNQPQMTIRMHVDHAAMFSWLQSRLPGSKVYGPYDHDGRHYYQWMARGRYLRETIIPILDQYLTPDLSQRVYDRYVAMKGRYQSRLGCNT